MNKDDSTNGICDFCDEPIKDCDCEDIACQKCEDGLPRDHKCASDSTICDFCDETVNDCNCQPSGHYD